MFVMTNTQYGTGFEVSEYNGKVSLISAKQGKDKVFQKWGDIEIGKDKTKRLPVSVEIGDSKEAAIKTLEAVIAYLKGSEGAPF